jgi:probable F420-dependent oxidoreductase
MSAVRPFRFATFSPGSVSRRELETFARKAESLGVSAIMTGSHQAFSVGGPLVELACMACATTSLRLSNHVFNNDLQHPALLASELATLDLISEGRVEIGIGAGWLKLDYTALGIPFDRGAVRLARMMEAVQLIKRLYGDEPVTHAGTYYRVESLNVQPKPVQRPHPPLFIGGGRQRLLSFAAREANIIGLDPSSTADGILDLQTATAAAYDQKVAWVREAAGDRFQEIELHVLILSAQITNNRARGVQEATAYFDSWGADVVTNVPRDTATVLGAPQILVGTVGQIIDDLRERRERYGISYITLSNDKLDEFAPVIEQLVGT